MIAGQRSFPKSNCKARRTFHTVRNLLLESHISHRVALSRPGERGDWGCFSIPVPCTRTLDFIMHTALREAQHVSRTIYLD